MAFLDDLEAAVREDLEDELGIVRTHILDAVRRDAPVISGALRDSIDMDDWKREGTVYRARIYATAPQAAWTNDGTGIYGPTGARIRPRNGRVLGPFYWHRIGETVAFASVAGQPAQHWFDTPDGDRMSGRLDDAFDAVFGL
jgi:hypothetical protein